MANEQNIQILPGSPGLTGVNDNTALSPLEKDELKKKIQLTINRILSNNT